jgi:hypothetical protein
MTESRQNDYRCLPTTKPIDKELEIISQETLVVNPSLGLECVRLREDFRIPGDSPEAITVRPSYFS